MTKHTSAIMLIAGAMMMATASHAPAMLPVAPEQSSWADKLQITRISAFTQQQIDLPASVDGPVVVTVNLDGRPYRLDLKPHSVRASDFRVLVQGDDGELREVPAPTPCTFRGGVQNQPGSSVAAAIFDGTLRAYIELGPDGGVYCVQPASEFANGETTHGLHVSYRSADVAPDRHGCGADDIEQPFHGIEHEQDAGGPPAPLGTGHEVCEIAVDADLHFFYKCSSSVANTVADVESVYDVVDMVYERDTDINFELTTIVVRSSYGSNPYSMATDAGEVLCEFRNLWNDTPESFIRRDVAQLFTGKNIDGYTIGLAWIGVVCNVQSYACYSTDDIAYSIVESKWAYQSWDKRIALSAHELGHNWNATHCAGGTCHIMCDTMDGCGGTQGANLKFGTQAKSEIISFRNSRWCLTDEPDSLEPPFFDDFPTTSFNSDNWTYNAGAKMSTAGIGEPSSPYSVQLNSLAPDGYYDDELRSNFILLDGESDLVASYWVQHRGVESGEEFIVEYRTDDPNWAVLGTHVSDGVDQDVFTKYTYSLPADAYHDEFRLRFRPDGDDEGDRWYVDDVYVGEEISDCPEDVTGDDVVDVLDLLEVLSDWGPCPGCPTDINGDDIVDVLDLLALLSAWGPC